MSNANENPLVILKELSALLIKEGQEDKPVFATVSSLKKALLAQGYQDDDLVPESLDYTQKRASSLYDLSSKLRATLVANTKADVSYSDKAECLAIVSNSYLHLAHAFKVDPKVWSFAQKDLVPTLSAVVDEKSLDEAVSRLFFHLDRYLTSLNKWLKK